jgi:hypothetical protein
VGELMHPLLQFLSEKGSITCAGFLLMVAAFCGPAAMRYCIGVAGFFIFIYAGWVPWTHMVWWLQ